MGFVSVSVLARANTSSSYQPVDRLGHRRHVKLERLAWKGHLRSGAMMIRPSPGVIRSSRLCGPFDYIWWHSARVSFSFFFDSSAISGTYPMSTEFVVEQDLQRCLFRVLIPDTSEYQLLFSVSVRVSPTAPQRKGKKERKEKTRFCLYYP